VKRTLAALLCFLVAAPSLFAWTSASDLRIAKKAASLGPDGLRVLINKYDVEYQRGLSRAAADEGSEGHHYFVLTRQGRLRDQIEAETRTAVTMLRTRQPLPLVVEHLGILTHLVADANNPFHIANDDPRLESEHADFEDYFERRMLKFPTVFYGLDINLELSSYLDRTFDRTRRFYPLMTEEYFGYGDPRTSGDFDDRSTAFGVASVCYSHAVTDMVNLYYYIWKNAGGDVRAASVMRSGNLLLNAY